MLKVHLNTGKTLKFILTDPNQLRDWFTLVKSFSFQQTITGLTIINQGVSYSLPRPKDFNDISFFAESLFNNNRKSIKGGERLICHAGNIEIILTAYNSQKSVRVDIAKPGKQTYNPIYVGG